MGLRFYRRVSIVPGLRLNLSRSGPSLSIGHRGLWYTIGRESQRVTAGLPGTGMYWTENVTPSNAPRAGHQLLFVAAIVALLILIGVAFP